MSSRPSLAPVARALVFAAALASAACLQLPEGERLVHVERSAWQTLVVSDSATRRCLRFGDDDDALEQSCKLLAQSDHLVFDYTRAMVAMLLLWRPEPRRVLIIGVGGGSIPRALAATRPGMSIDAVDIDDAVLRVAQTHFGLKPGPKLRLHAADGAGFIAAARTRGEKFDAVLLDAFDSEGIPPALFGEDFLRDVRAVLAPDGVFLANTFVATAAYSRESVSAERVFGRFHNVRLRESGGNRLLIAVANPDHLRSRTELMAEWRAEAASLERLGIDAAWIGQLRFADPDWSRD